MYVEADSEFAELVRAHPTFAPRERFITAQEAEQDAYFWFQAGQRVVLKMMEAIVEKTKRTTKAAPTSASD